MMKKSGGIIAAAILLAVGTSMLQRRSDDRRAEKRPVMNQNPAALAVFESKPLDSRVLSRMQGVSLPSDALIGIGELRYLSVPYYGFDGKVHNGELVVHESIAEDVLCIFQELLDQKYPIERMCLIDDYCASDEKSMEANNTSAFNYRVIAGTNKLSNHGRGLAIDINPLYNPYVKVSRGKITVEPLAALPYADRRREFEHKITEDDVCCRIFKKYGFVWGGDWKNAKDYQHFEKSPD